MIKQNTRLLPVGWNVRLFIYALDFAYNRTYLSCDALFRKLNPETKNSSKYKSFWECACMRPNPFPLNHLTWTERVHATAHSANILALLNILVKTVALIHKETHSGNTRRDESREKKSLRKWLAASICYGLALPIDCVLSTRNGLSWSQNCVHVDYFASPNRGFLFPPKNIPFTEYWIDERFPVSVRSIITMIRHHEKHLNDDRYFEYHVV